MEFVNDRLRLIDQRKLPGTYEFFECATYEDVVFAIKDMVVRGAPAIGAAAAYGVALAAGTYQGLAAAAFRQELEQALTSAACNFSLNVYFTLRLILMMSLVIAS